MKRTFMTVGLVTLALAITPSFSGTTYHPSSPSHEVSCNMVDSALAKIPQGNGDGAVGASELGPGGWHFNGNGQSFATFRHFLTGDTYAVIAGRSRVRANFATVNDYPARMDFAQAPLNMGLQFKKSHGVIVLSGDTRRDPPRFTLPGNSEGWVRVHMRDRDGDGVYEGCASTPWLSNFGVLVPEGGDFLQQNYIKIHAVTNGDGVVTFFEMTEISTFKEVRSGQDNASAKGKGK